MAHRRISNIVECRPMGSGSMTPPMTTATVFSTARRSTSSALLTDGCTLATLTSLRPRPRPSWSRVTSLNMEALTLTRMHDAVRQNAGAIYSLRCIEWLTNAGTVMTPFTRCSGKPAGRRSATSTIRIAGFRNHWKNTRISTAVGVLGRRAGLKSGRRDMI